MVGRIYANERALERFCKEWCACSKETPLPLGQVAEADRCPPDCLVSEALALMAELPARPVEELAPAIRVMVEDCRFHGESGDRIIDGHYQASVDREAELILAALRRLKERAMQCEGCGCDVIEPYMPATARRMAV